MRTIAPGTCFNGSAGFAGSCGSSEFLHDVGPLLLNYLQSPINQLLAEAVCESVGDVCEPVFAQFIKG